MRSNLELKVKYPLEKHKNDLRFFEKYFDSTLHQKDTYYQTSNGRLKLREQMTCFPDKNKSPIFKAYAIRYDRENEATERKCFYDFYEIPDVSQFKKVFGGAFTTEIVVKKKRKLYLYRNARIHIDDVKGLEDEFLEIEIVINNEQQNLESEDFMKELIEKLKIQDDDKLSLGYRELLCNTQ